MKRALVTGASGFLGRSVVSSLLQKGYEVHACSRAMPSEIGATCHSVDLLNHSQTIAALNAIRPSHLVHMAWNVDNGYWTSPSNLEWTSATLNLLRAFHLSGGLRFIGAGTCAEYDWDSLPAFIKESTLHRPATLYGVAKNSTRQLVESYCDLMGLSHAWGVLFMSYGSGERPNRLVPSVICNLLAGNEAKVTAGTQVRDFLDSRDVGAAFAALTDSDVIGSVNIASGQSTAIKDVIKKIGDLLGRQDLLRIGALPTKQNEPDRIVADTTRLSSEVLFKPRIEIDEGLESTIAWWRTKIQPGQESLA
ncbi:NAD-dependent epimerase/dehydratase family protein [Bacillus sp. DC4300-2b2]|uniref:NAD-dependent epimerase/dehydratase family protein n=1 Tax=Bacillus sp. DC4300-2b2 TaxID=2809038 RepID=UPI003CE9DF38